MQTTSLDSVTIVRKALDLFQKGGYRERLTFDEVVPLTNTRMDSEVSKPFRPMSYDQVVNALQQLERIGYPIKIENEKIRFTRYPW
jgi:hypothetical protein